jgi:DNA-binding PucR family transcriptional regulator
VGGAISTTGRPLGRIAQRRREAEDAVDVLRARNDQRFAAYDAVRPQVILRELGQVLAQREDLRLPGLHLLADEDARRGGDLLSTPRTYLRCADNASAAARQLGIHVTTLRYRVSRIAEIIGLDLGDPTVRLVCGLLLTAEGAGPE